MWFSLHIEPVNMHRVINVSVERNLRGFHHFLHVVQCELKLIDEKSYQQNIKRFIKYDQTDSITSSIASDLPTVVCTKGTF